MGYPSHYLAQFGGTLRTDVWSVGIRMVNVNEPAGLDGADQDNRAQDYFGKMLTYMQSANSGWSSAAVLTYCKFNHIDEDGHYVDPNNTHEYFGTPGAAATAPTFPNQIALAVSWVTDRTRGIASSGRIYIPCPANATILSTGKFATSSAVLFATSAAVFINNLNNDPALSAYQLEAHVVSRGKKTGTTTWGTGASEKIRSVRVGNVFDTQRRRRNALVEDYGVNTTAIN